MAERVRYTDEEVAVIEGQINAYCPRMRSSPALQDAYLTVYKHLESGTVNEADLKRIEELLELTDPLHYTGCSMEGRRDLVSALMTTKALLRQVQG